MTYFIYASSQILVAEIDRSRNFTVPEVNSPELRAHRQRSPSWAASPKKASEGCSPTSDKLKNFINLCGTCTIFYCLKDGHQWSLMVMTCHECLFSFFIRKRQVENQDMFHGAWSKFEIHFLSRCPPGVTASCVAPPAAPWTLPQRQWLGVVVGRPHTWSAISSECGAIHQC